MVARPQKAIIIGGTWRVEKTGALLKHSERLASGVLTKKLKLTVKESKLNTVPSFTNR